MSPAQTLIDQVLANPAIAPLLHAAPQSVLMPFATEHDKQYLMVSLLLRDTPTLEALAHLSCAVVGVASDNGLLSGLHGFEVMFGFISSGKAQRALRLSALSSAIPQMAEITAAELQVPQPHEGMSSILYASNLRQQASRNV